MFVLFSADGCVNSGNNHLVGIPLNEYRDGLDLSICLDILENFPL